MSVTWAMAWALQTLLHSQVNPPFQLSFPQAQSHFCLRYLLMYRLGLSRSCLPACPPLPVRSQLALPRSFYYTGSSPIPLPNPHPQVPTVDIVHLSFFTRLFFCYIISASSFPLFPLFSFLSQDPSFEHPHNDQNKRTSSCADSVTVVRRRCQVVYGTTLHPLSTLDKSGGPTEARGRVLGD